MLHASVILIVEGDYDEAEKVILGAAEKDAYIFECCIIWLYI
jgi:hypothetical protein